MSDPAARAQPPAGEPATRVLAAGRPGTPGRWPRSWSGRWARLPDGTHALDPAELAPGFRAAGVAARIKGAGESDVGLVVCDPPDVASALLLTPQRRRRGGRPRLSPGMRCRRGEGRGGQLGQRQRGHR